jgi:RNA polymerase sigma factor (TIGR02999 family)
VACIIEANAPFRLGFELPFPLESFTLETVTNGDEFMSGEREGSLEGTWGNVWNAELYDELRGLAASELARLPSGGTLGATALVHEAWLKLGADEQRWRSRAHFFGAAAQAMRHILVDQARRKTSMKHGGDQQRVDLNESAIMTAAPDSELLAVHETLERLAAHDSTKAELVSLRYFVGLSLEEAADILGLSLATAKRSWAYARAWLYREICRERNPGQKRQPMTLE